MSSSRITCRACRGSCSNSGNFSRPGGQIAVQYYNFLRLGHEGYRKIHEAGHVTAQFLAQEIAAMGPFEILYDGDPANGIPALAWKLREGVDHGFTLFDLADRLRVSGWQVPAYTCPRTARTSPSSASWSGTISAATWPRCCWTTTAAPWSTSAVTRSSSR